MSRAAWLKALGAIVVALGLAAAYWLLQRPGGVAAMLDGAVLHQRIVQLGMWGPAAVVGLMALAILVSPIPSAPIAVAAGMAYGHVWGTVYIVIGAETGALAAFGLAHVLGHEILRRWFGDRVSVGWLGSQNTLMGIVFLSRLLPFISFDLVSYAAGLTVLSWWRFAIATLAGIVPTSFLLAHFGGEMANGDPYRTMLAVIGIGTITLIPVVAKLVHDRLRSRRRERPAPPSASGS